MRTIKPASIIICSCMLVFIFCLPAQLKAQKKIATARLDKNEAKSLNQVFKNYSLFTIDAPGLAKHAGAATNKQIQVEFDGAALPFGQLDLKENNLLTDDYQARLGTADGYSLMARPSIKTYKGTIAGNQESKVYLSVSDKNISGYFKLEGKQYYIEPLRYFDKQAAPNSFVLYEAGDLQPHASGCGVTEAHRRASQLEEEASLRATGRCRMVETAIASDYTMLLRYGTAAEVEERNISIMNLMVGIFQETQLGAAQFPQYLEFKIKGQYIAGSAAADPLLNGNEGLDAELLLESFRAWGQANRFGFTYDMAQLWTNKNFSGNVIGLAYVGSTCMSYRYQLLEDGSLSSLTEAVLAAHETGHNLNAMHDNSGDPYIMAPSIASPPYTSFSATSKTTFNSFLNSYMADCIYNCEILPEARISASANAVCVTNSQVSFTDHSIGMVTSRQWSFPEANISSSTIINPTVSYSTPGIKQVTLNVQNPFGSAQASKSIMVLSPLLAACRTVTAATTGSTGLFRFSLGDIDHEEDSWLVGSKYRDHSCAAITKLSPGRTYQGKAFIGHGPFSSGGNKVQIFIDYNNNGNLTDANEILIASSDCVNDGEVAFNVTMPQTVAVINTLLRMRVVVLPCAAEPVDGCNIPQNYQVYDFGVYFNQATCLVTYYQDMDGDSFGNPDASVSLCVKPTGYVTNNQDCNDQNAAIHPNTFWVKDFDEDLYYEGSPVRQCAKPALGWKIWPGGLLPGDCNDQNGAINPATIWVLDKDADNYYSGSQMVQCAKPTNDHVIKSTQLAGDCNDNDAAINPAAAEVCGNGKDDNCNGQTDEAACYVCGNATSISTTNITSNSATLNWVSIPHPLEWQLRYKATSNGSRWNEVTVPGYRRSYTVAGLANNQAYMWQIRTKCGRAWTDYSNTIAFITGGQPTFAKNSSGMEQLADDKFNVTVMPNPSNTNFKIMMPRTDLTTPVQVMVTDLQGRKIESRIVPSGPLIIIGDNYRIGTYFVTVTQGTNTSQLKLIKLP